MILLFDTSTPTGYLALGDEKRVLATATWQAEQSHSRELPPQTNTALASAGMSIKDLTHLCVGIGPGSFTGLRVALATAKGLGIATGIPIIAIPSLTIFAAFSQTTTPYIVSTTDAFRGELYVGIFQHTAGPRPYHLVGEILSMPPTRAIEIIRNLDAPFTAIGTGMTRYATEFKNALGDFPITSLTTPYFAGALQLAATYARDNRYQDPAVIQPFYVRQAEAVEKRRKS